MPKKKSFDDLSAKTVSADLIIYISKYDEKPKHKYDKIIYIESIQAIITQYGFNNLLDFQALINNINSWYKLVPQIPKEPTEKQTATRLSELHNQITTLRDTIDKLNHKEKTLLIRASEYAEVKFIPSESTDYLNQLARHTFMAIPNNDLTSRRGRPKRTEVNIVLEQLYNAYQLGTGKKPTCSFNDYEERYTSDFVEFCEDIIKLLDFEITNISIGEYMKLKRADLKNKRKNTS